MFLQGPVTSKSQTDDQLSGPLSSTIFQEVLPSEKAFCLASEIQSRLWRDRCGN